MRILISGASGLIGTAIVERWSAPAEAGPAHEVVRLVRRAAASGPGEIPWDPQEGELNPAAVEGFDAVVHLAGENVGEGRWTAAKKTRIRDSRVRGTELFCRTLASLTQPPQVLLSASAIGYYGDRGDEELDEASPAGSGFLAGVCRDWEAAIEPAAEAGIRVVRMRMAVVLAPEGGAMAPILRIFRLGLGGPLGSGRQYLSWIALEDLVEAIEFLRTHPSLSGPVNLSAPEPVTNRHFAQSLARALGRPAIFPVPAMALRFALGEMADEMVLASARVLPRRLLEAGFTFRYSKIEESLSAVAGAGK